MPEIGIRTNARDDFRDDVRVLVHHCGDLHSHLFANVSCPSTGGKNDSIGHDLRAKINYNLYTMSPVNFQVNFPTVNDLLIANGHTFNAIICVEINIGDWAILINLCPIQFCSFCKGIGEAYKEV